MNTTTPTPKNLQRVDCVWCACWQRCGGVFVPGVIGVGIELCHACHAANVAEQNTQQPLERKT